MKERKKPRVKLRLPLQVYLLYLLVVTFMCTGVTIAKYMTTTTNSAAARVAAFSVSASSDTPVDPQSAILDCAAQTPQISYNLTVSSESEVAVKYDVVITLSQPLVGVSMTLDGKSPTINGAVYTFRDVGQIAPAGGNNDHTLVLSADADIILSDMETQIHVVVHAEQLDEIG